MKRRLEIEQENKQSNLKVVVVATQKDSFLGMADECISEHNFKQEGLSDKFKRIVRITSVPKIVPSYIN